VFVHANYIIIITASPGATLNAAAFKLSQRSEVAQRTCGNPNKAIIEYDGQQQLRGAEATG
jgi:hypothetical protein